LSLFRYFEVGLRVCDIVVKKLTFAISSPDEFLLRHARPWRPLASTRLPHPQSCGSYVRTSPFAAARGDKMSMRPFVKILYDLLLLLLLKVYRYLLFERNSALQSDRHMS